MSQIRVAVLGGDAREIYIAEQLLVKGYQVAVFGAAASHASQLAPAVSPEAAVTGANWIICPSPGLGDGDRVYAPDCSVPITLNAALFTASDAATGGLILGRATPEVTSAAKAAGVAVFEMKDDRALAVSNATSVAEALVALLVGKTRRVLPAHRLLVIGYGATGAAFTDALLGLACGVRVTARRAEHLERARQRGAQPVDYAARVQAMAESDIVVNTVPSPDAIPHSAFPRLREAIVVDIASPPGGTDHVAAGVSGIDLTWARGLAGARAPLSAGDAQLRFITDAIRGSGPRRQPTSVSHGPSAKRA
jgi:dipicolinate synthase subunit A